MKRWNSFDKDTHARFFLFFITNISPIRKIKNDTINTKTPGMMPYIASSQLACGPFTIGSATETPVTSKPSSNPRMPKTRIIFQIILFSSRCFAISAADGGTLRLRSFKRLIIAYFRVAPALLLDVTAALQI